MRIINRKIRKEDFVRVWVCHVFRSGYHNGARCTPGEAHGFAWHCGWRNEFQLSLTDDQMEEWRDSG